VAAPCSGARVEVCCVCVVAGCVDKNGVESVGRLWTQVHGAEHHSVWTACAQDAAVSINDLHSARLRRNLTGSAWSDSFLGYIERKSFKIA